jgi:hypothetical protein
MLFSAIFVCSPIPCLDENKKKVKNVNVTECTLLLQVLHLLFAWSSVISWIMLVGDVALIAFLSLHAYRDGEFLNQKTSR